MHFFVSRENERIDLKPANLAINVIRNYLKYHISIAQVLKKYTLTNT